MGPKRKKEVGSWVHIRRNGWLRKLLGYKDLTITIDGTALHRACQSTGGLRTKDKKKNEIEYFKMRLGGMVDYLYSIIDANLNKNLYKSKKHDDKVNKNIPIYIHDKKWWKENKEAYTRELRGE